jgi:hypothetical protein
MNKLLIVSGLIAGLHVTNIAENFLALAIFQWWHNDGDKSQGSGI